MLYEFILGYFYSVKSINYLADICSLENSKKIFKLSLSISFFFILDSIIRYAFTFDVKKNLIINFIFLLGNIIYYTFWLVPVYIIFNIVLLDKLNNILSNINILKNFNNSQDSISNKIYFMLISCVLYLLIQFSNLIPYFGIYIQYLLIPYSYGYFCLEYVCHYKSIMNHKKIYIIEKNPWFFIGYGVNYTILYYIMNPISFLLAFIIMFPLNVIQLYYVNLENDIVKDVTISSKIFIIPIWISNILLSLLDSYLITLYN